MEEDADQLAVGDGSTKRVQFGVVPKVAGQKFERLLPAAVLRRRAFASYGCIDQGSRLQQRFGGKAAGPCAFERTAEEAWNPQRRGNRRC